MSYSIHPDKEVELGDAAVYYATYASAMVALAFLAEYERVRDLLIENKQRMPRGEDCLRVYDFTCRQAGVPVATVDALIA